MIIDILVLILGFGILIKGADLFVDGAANLAQNFKLSKTLIALTIVAFGTSAPEFAISVQAIMAGNGEIVLGNVIGSNILNILLILGASSLFHTLEVKNNTVKKELPILLLMTILLSILTSDNLFDKTQVNVFGREDGFVVALFFAVFVYYLISMIRNKVDDDSEPAKYKIWKSIFLTAFGLVAIIVGSDFVVDSSTNIATTIGVSQRIIALTIVAFGTSLPELVTSIVATRKGEHDIAIGNIVGSCIFNIGIVLGTPVAFFGGLGKLSFNYFDIIAMIVASILLFAFAYRDRNITRKEGIILLTLFVAYYTVILFI